MTVFSPGNPSRNWIPVQNSQKEKAPKERQQNLSEERGKNPQKTKTNNNTKCREQILLTSYANV
jgi:hypothetical protein